ncbi:UNVERIFIED_CONTAM: hypothetical protein GTU68_025382, partial [Idotea baltica]|nr:hypothetical protein [Idotea baltica]
AQRKGRKAQKSSHQGDSKKEEEEEGELQHLHLQGVEASTSRRLEFASKAMSINELFVNDISRESPAESFSSCSLQQSAHNHRHSREIRLLSGFSFRELASTPSLRQPRRTK